MTTFSTAKINGPLSGLKGVSLAANIPGPVMTQVLRQEGMAWIKVEPPTGDLLAEAAPSLYQELVEGIEVQAIDLRNSEGQVKLQNLLSNADLLVTSHRPSALARLGITAQALGAAYPDLCWIEIVGDKENPDVAGHDLTYQLQVDLVRPPEMPTTLLADLSGAQEAARTALTLLLGRERGSPERHRRIGLKQAACALALPVRHGLTAPSGWLSGTHPTYRLYQVRNGWAGVAALESHFARRLNEILNGQPIEEFFSVITVEECNTLAEELDLPIHAVEL